ncbi:MAG: hypothetical protein Q9225_003636 [Loekoesia sp. 1 TL-2023]
MLPTPSTSHVDTDRIYEPAEDSFLFLDTLSSAAEVSFLKERFSAELCLADQKLGPSPLIVEAGIGSGVVLAFLTAHAQTLLGRSDVLSLGVDINPYACKASRQTVEQASQGVAKGLNNGPKCSNTGLFLTSLNADLTSVIRSNSVDVLIFNPPYVPTPEVLQCVHACTRVLEDSMTTEKQIGVEADSDMLSLSYAGGVDGMEVTNRLLEQLPYALDSERGVAYILLCEQNKPEEVVKRIQHWGADWSVEVVGRSGKQGGWEKLLILRICRGCFV